MLAMSSHWRYVLVVFCFLASSISQETSDICGLRDKVEGQACITVKLPWESAPMYFCKPDITFRKCPWNFTCYNEKRTENVLEVQAPWMCCKQMSYPNPCENLTCPDPPLNRTCSPKKRYKGACCDSFYCGPPEQKDQWPECTDVVCPDTKTDDGCIVFSDQYSCCSFSQCPDTARPGVCPTIKKGEWMAQWLRDAYNSKKGYTGVHSCTGDYTCPTGQKCCPGYHYHKTNWGYCYEQQSDATTLKPE